MSEIAIRLRRAAFNEAIAHGDANAIAPLLADGAVLVTGTDSAVIAGRKQQLAVWRREFASRERMVYTRTPERIELSAVEPIALEHGQWQGIGGGQVASGRYAAKWRETGGAWVIEAELYLTLA